MSVRKKVAQGALLIAGLLAGGGLFAYLVYRSGPENVLSSLSAFGILPLVGFVCISLLNFTLYTLRWKIILDDMTPSNRRIPFFTLFMHRMSGYAAGYLTPAAQVAGEPIRVAMLRADGVPLQEATGSVVLDLAFEITSFVVYVIAGVTFAFAEGLGGDGNLFWPLVFVCILLALLSAFFLTIARGKAFFSHLLTATKLVRFRRLASFATWLRETETLMSRFFAGKGLTLVGVVFLSFVLTAFKAVEVVYISSFLGAHMTIADAFLMSTLPGVALLLPVPGGLGVYEGTNAAMFALLGLNLNAIAFTIVIRIRDAVFIALGVFHAIKNGMRLTARQEKAAEKRV